MSEWTLSADGQSKYNPRYKTLRGENASFTPPIITRDAVFDEVWIFADMSKNIITRAMALDSATTEVYVLEAENRIDFRLYPRNIGGDWSRELYGRNAEPYYFYYDDEEEIVEIRRRIREGTCRVRYTTGWKIINHEEWHNRHWLLDLQHPFHADDRHLFFEHFTRNLGYIPRTLHEKQVFQVPGLWLDENPEFTEIRVHKRGSGITKPNVPYDGDYAAMVEAFAAQGWTVPVPAGFGTVHQFIQHYGHMSDGSPWWDPTVMHPVSGIEVSWKNIVHQLGAAYRAWETSNTSETGDAYAVTREWWKTWIGYAWELAETPRNSIRVWDTGSPRFARTIGGSEDVLEWAIGHLQEWAERGVDQFRSDVNVAVIESILDEPSLTHVQSTGTFGETLVGLIAAADWNRYQGRSFRTAAKVVSQVTANAGADFEVESGTAVVMQGSETIVDGFGTITYLWELVTGEGMPTLSATDVLRPTLTPPTLVAETEDKTLVYRLTVTNDGVSDTDEVTVTVLAPHTVVYANAGPDLTVEVNGSVEIVGTATYDNQVGESAYRWEKVSGEGSLHDPDSNSPDFTAPATPGTTVYRLTVTNNGVTGTDEVTITITAQE